MKPSRKAGPHVLRANSGVTDGARTRDLRSHNSREMGPVCSDVSVESAFWRYFVSSRLRIVRCVRARICPVAVQLQCLLYKSMQGSGYELTGTRLLRTWVNTGKRRGAGLLCPAPLMGSRSATIPESGSAAL